MRIFLIGIIVGAWATAAAAETPEEKGLRIAREIEKANDGFQGETTVTEMLLINAHGDEVKRKMKSKVMEVPGDGDKSIVEFVWPADVQGTRMLTWSHKQGDDDQWLFLPSIKRVKRIASRSKSGSFMGSEFSYEDLGSREVEQYAYTFLREEELAGRKCWVLQSIPKYERSGYSKLVSWVDQEYHVTHKVEFFDLKAELLKTMTLRNLQQHGRYWRPGEIEVVNQQTKKRSILRWAERKVSVPLNEDDFKSENMEQL